MSRQSAVKDLRHLDHRSRYPLSATRGTRRRRLVHEEPVGAMPCGVDTGVAWRAWRCEVFGLIILNSYLNIPTYCHYSSEFVNNLD